MANRSGNSASARRARMEATASYIGAGVVTEGGVVPPVLADLTVSPSSATVGQAYTGTVSGRTVGSQLTLSGAGAAGLTINSATGVITGTPTASGALNVVETLAGATGSPKTSAGVVTVAAASSKIAVGSKLGFIGDSIFNYNHLSATGVNQIRTLSRGELTYANMQSPRWRDDVWHDDADANGRFFTGANHGVSGDTTTGVLARLNALITMAPAIAIVAIGTNNLSPTATAISEIQQICEQLLAANIKVLLCTVRPWSTAKSGDNLTSRTNRVTVNTGIRSYAATKNANVLRLCDLDLVYDPDNDGYGPVSWFADGLHPNDFGASNAASFIRSVLDDWFDTGNWLIDNLWASGNLQTNPTFTGTGGGVSAGVTGVVPASWRVQRASGALSTCVVSTEANADTGGNSIVLDVTPIGTAVNERFEVQIGSTGLVTTAALDGQWAMAFAELEYDDKTWWGCPQLQFFHGTDGAQFSSGGYNNLAPINMAPVNGKLWVATPPILMPAGLTGYKFILQTRFNPTDGVAAGNAPARVKVRRAWVNAIPNPKAVWNS